MDYETSNASRDGDAMTEEELGRLVGTAIGVAVEGLFVLCVVGIVIAITLA